MNLTEIQHHLAEKKHDVRLITRNNLFLGQDTLERENLILTLTGFSGSAGTLIVTRQKSYLFTDGRYEIQAARQVNPKETEVICDASPTSWLQEHFPAQIKLEYDPWCISIREILQMRQQLPCLRLYPKTEPHVLEPAGVFAHELQYCGMDDKEKCALVLEQIRLKNCRACLLTAADSVSWLTNLRSNALPDTPVVRAMALLRDDTGITLFADKLSFPRNYPHPVLPLAKLEKELATAQDLTFAVDEQRTPDAIRRIFEKHKIKTVCMDDPCQPLKARKNKTEINGMINAHLRDGTAVCKFLCWLKHNNENLSELDIVEKLHKFREQQPLYYSDSFPTIAGVGTNAAIIHYQPTVGTNTPLKKNTLLLIDSGGQYFNGTTDITRTIALGTPSKEMKEKFTIVLKAHIALASARFPKNVPGTVLDTICRSVMWRFGLDYKHGTGHGVGCFLNVHEGPQNIGPRSFSCPIEENMVVSIEPGWYQENAFGIRVENLVCVIADNQLPDMLKFSILTMVPLDKHLIDKHLLTNGEIEWVNNYHREVFQKISPNLTKEEKSWLEEACSPL